MIWKTDSSSFAVATMSLYEWLKSCSGKQIFVQVIDGYAFMQCEGQLYLAAESEEKP